LKEALPALVESSARQEKAREYLRQAGIAYDVRRN
jgi:hypothetical protein